MPADRYYLNAFFEEGAEAFLDEHEKRHLFTVMRGAVGDEIELVNGRGQWAKAIVTRFDKKTATVSIRNVLTEPSPSFRIILCQAIPRMNRLDTILEKGTEIGMHEIWLFPGEKGERETLSDSQKRRLEAITVSALKQCGRLDLPKIFYKPLLTQWDLIPYPAYFGDTSKAAPSFSKTVKKENGICIFIGSEAGFSENELNFFHQKGVVGLKLNPNILRTDTAALVALSLICNL